MARLKSESLQALCDLACTIFQRNQIAGFERSHSSEELPVEQQFSQLRQISGQKIGDDIREWAIWIEKAEQVALDSPEGSMVQAIKILGRLRKFGDSGRTE